MRRLFRSDDLIIVCCAGAAMVLLALAAAVVAPQEGPGGRASTFSARTDGAKAAFLTLQALGYRVERTFEPIASLRVDPARTALVIASPSRKPSNLDARALRTFVEQGGLVLATGVGEELLPELEGVTMMNGALFELSEKDKRHVYHAASGAGEALRREASAIHIVPEVTGAPPAGTPFRPVYTSTSTAAAGGGAATATGGAADAGVRARDVGRGRIVWWIGSTPLVNGDITQPGHVELLLHTLGPAGERVVLWDEYDHGYGRGLWSYIAGTPLGAAFAQLIVIAAAALFTVSRRRGPIYAVPRAARASAMEFVAAMAALYRKARATSGAVEIARARLRRLLVAGAQLPAGSADETLARAAASRYALDEPALRELLAASAEAARLRPRDLPPARALALVQRLQDTASAVVAAASSSSASSSSSPPPPSRRARETSPRGA